MYKFQDLTPISGHFRTNFKISKFQEFHDNAQAWVNSVYLNRRHRIVGRDKQQVLTFGNHRLGYITVT